jgi:hypothetical protein
MQASRSERNMNSLFVDESEELKSFNLLSVKLSNVVLEIFIDGFHCWMFPSKAASTMALKNNFMIR